AGLVWSAAVLCSAAFVSPFRLLSGTTRRGRTREKGEKQERQSKALPHSRQKSVSAPPARLRSSGCGPFARFEGRREDAVLASFEVARGPRRGGGPAGGQRRRPGAEEAGPRPAPPRQEARLGRARPGGVPVLQGHPPGGEGGPGGVAAGEH